MSPLVIALLAAGLPNLTYPPAELMKPLSIIKSRDPLGFKRGHSSVALQQVAGSTPGPGRLCTLDAEVGARHQRGGDPNIGSAVPAQRPVRKFGRI